MTTTKRDLQALHYLVTRLRSEVYGAGKWDDNGITAALAKLEGRNLASVVEQVTRHAMDPEARNPGAISRPFLPPPPSAHEQRWQPTPGPWCGICGRAKDHHPSTDHAFELAPDRKRDPEAIRAIVEDAKQRKEPTRTTPEDPHPTTTHDPRATAVRAKIKEDADA